MLDNWIRALSFFGDYPIPWQPDNIEALDQIPSGSGVLYCWTHLPLIEIPLRALSDLGRPMDLIVADPGKIVDGDEFVVPGLKAHIKVIPVDQRILTRVRTALRQGKSVACLADSELFGPMYSHSLRVAGMVRAFVIFTWAERLPDGTLKVNFIPAPYPYCKTDVEIAENLEYLRDRNSETLRALNALPE